MYEKDKKKLIRIAIEEIRKLLKGEFEEEETNKKKMAKTLKGIADRDGSVILPEILENVIQTGIFELAVDYVDAEKQIRKIKHAAKEKQKNKVIPELMINLISEVVRSEYKKQDL